MAEFDSTDRDGRLFAIDKSHGVGRYRDRESAILISNGLCVSPGGYGSDGYEKDLADVRKVVAELGGSAKSVDDATIMRFLRARSIHIKKAAKMFVNYQKWRESFVPRGYIPDEEVANELATNKLLLQGASRKGWPLLIGLGCKHFPNTDNFEEFKRFVVHLLDKTLASAPPGGDRLLVIIDLDQIGYKNVDVKGFITGFQFLQNYYPERLGRLYIVNAPDLFMGAWKVVSRFLDKPTKEKIMFLGYSEISEVLLEEVDENILPSKYGGKAQLVLLQDAHVPNWPPTMQC
eukprot:c26014_g1_i1 orf=412-1281(-)